MEQSAVRKHIKDTARNLFFKFGVKRVSVEELAREANVSKVTFYKYYKNKNELALELRDELMEEGFSKFDKLNSLDIPFMEKVKRMTEWQMEFYSQFDNEFVKEMVNMRDVEEEYKKRFIKNMESGLIRGEIRKDINLELVFLMTKKIKEITSEGTWKQLFSDYGEYIQQVRTILFYGLLSRSEQEKTVEM
ncbi:MAG: TetR/AcrR family transcriptional regulator [Candidatus Latescibacteria bacterium]|nr:TetR/AcrR family transcriptional regulator [Candidatus Latescibacterota bacterium]